MTFNYRVMNKYITAVSDYHFYFVDDDFEISFYQSGNGDLNFLVSCNNIDNVILKINKDKHPELFEAFDKFYKKYDTLKNRFGYDELFQDGYFSWKSDAPANEEDWDKQGCEFIYNYLNITPSDDEYVLEFINNIRSKRFVVEFNTDRSRYGAMVFPVCELFHSLKHVLPSYDEPDSKDVKTLAKKEINHIIS